MAPFDGRPPRPRARRGRAARRGVDDRPPGRIRGRGGRRRAPLPPVRRDERRLDRRVEPRGGPLTTPAGVRQGRCHPAGRGPGWCPLAVRGARSRGAAGAEHRRRRRNGRRPARRADPRARAAGPPGRAEVDRGLRDEVDRWGATFDGRLRVCAVDAGNGRRVVFGSRSAPPASVGQAVAASCAIPAIFAPVRIGDRLYVDGGAWSPTNADAAPAGRGDRVLLLEPTAVLVRGALRGAALLEAVALRSRGAVVKTVIPDDSARPLMGRLMDPDRRGHVLAAGYQQGLALGR